MKRKETDRALAARKRSHAYMQQQIEDETWVPLMVDTAQRCANLRALESTARHDVWLRFFCPLVCSKPTGLAVFVQVQIEFDLSAKDYLLALKGVPPPVTPGAPPMQPAAAKGRAAKIAVDHVPLHVLRATMPLKEQVITILRQAHVVRFNDLCSFVWAFLFLFYLNDHFFPLFF